jgi:hypothetical protein
MSRRSLLGALGIVVLLLASMSAGVVLLLRLEPRHHRAAHVPPSAARTQHSRDFQRNFTDLFSSVGQDRWGKTFTDEQVNSYLSEGFLQPGWADKVLPEGISEPRVNFEPERMRVSFRYSSPLLSTIISLTLRVWLTPSEPNVMALCIEGFHAGAVPFKAQWLLERFSEVARQHDLDVSWYRHEGHPVALLRFQANQVRPTIRLKTVHFDRGQLTIQGESSPDRPRTGINGPPGS